MVREYVYENSGIKVNNVIKHNKGLRAYTGRYIELALVSEKVRKAEIYSLLEKIIQNLISSRPFLLLF